MKISCEKALLMNAVNLSSRTVAPKSSIPALEGLLLEAKEDHIQITGYDLKTGIRSTLPAEIREEGSMVLSSRLFGEIIRRMPDDVVVISTQGYTVNLKCGMSEFNIQGIDASEYPDLPAVDYMKSFQIKQNSLRDMIERTSFAISQSDARPVHTGSLFDVEQDGEEYRLTMVAVDGYRLALRRERLSQVSANENFKFVVPGAALKEVQRIASEEDKEIQVVMGERHVMFKTEEVTLVTRRLEGEFLNYKQAIPTNSSITVTVDTRHLIDSIDRCSLIISEQQKSPLRCVFEDGLIRIRTSTALGNAYDECPSDGDGKGLEIGFNNRYMLDALKAVPTPSVHLALNTPVSPCVITRAEGSSMPEDAFTYMVLPVRLKAGV
ncbi:MAG: DNA polymerase III subunit beta [Clostridiales bacterium]|nr:DNA polymerase III subunit beta [Clostridiales bacterium]